MPQDKFSFLLGLLSPDERRRFRAWLRSELRGQERVQWQWLRARLKGWTPAQAWAELFPGKRLDQRQVNTIHSRLTHRLEQFIALEALRQDPTMMAQGWAFGMLRRDPEAFVKVLLKIRSDIESASVRDDQYYRLQYALNRMERELMARYPGRSFRGYKPPAPETVIRNQEMAWIMETLFDGLTRLSFRQPLSTIHASAREALAAYPEEQAGQFLGRLYDLVSGRVPASRLVIRPLLEDFEALYACFRPDMQHNLFASLQNQLVQAYRRRGSPWYMRRQARIYQWAFELRLLPYHHRHVYNAIMAHIRLQERQQAVVKTLIRALAAAQERHRHAPGQGEKVLYIKDRLKARQAEATVLQQRTLTYREALLARLPEADAAMLKPLLTLQEAFAQGDYERVMELGQVADVGDVFFDMDRQWTLLKAQYEMERAGTLLDGPDLSNQIRAFQSRLKRREGLYEAYRHAMKAASLMLKSLAGAQRDEVQNLRGRLNKEITLLDRNWMRRKLMDLFRT